MPLKPNNSSALSLSSSHRGAVADGQFSESYSASSHAQARSIKIRNRFPISPGVDSKNSLTFFSFANDSAMSHSSSQMSKLRPTLRRATLEQVSSAWKKSEFCEVVLLLLLLFVRAVVEY